MNKLSSCLIVIPFYIFEVVSQGQPDCPHFRHTLRFYEHHSTREKYIPSICRDTFDEILGTCIRLYEKAQSKKVEAAEIPRDADKIARKCTKRKMKFWQKDNSTTPESLAEVTVDVDMFTCPLTKMDLKLVNESVDLKFEDFYLSEGTDELSVAALHRSTSTDNICLTHVFNRQYIN